MNCLNCDIPLIKRGQKKFCSRSCAATFNNKLFPKRQPQTKCYWCDNLIISAKRYCSEECKKAARLERSSNLNPTPNKVLVASRRRKVKEILVEEAGGVCLDCGYKGPPFMFDFDHRDPLTKELRIGSGNTIGIDRLREEAKKCDLVCARCHRMRTHVQRCDGCEHCI